MLDPLSHASPVIAPQPRPPAHYFPREWDLNNNNLRENNCNGSATPSLPGTLLSPAFTPPSTPGLSSGVTTPSSSSRHHHHQHEQPKSIPVIVGDPSSLEPSPGSASASARKQPRLLERLPHVECVVRARIPTTSGAEMFLHLYVNDVDDKEHLAIVFGEEIRSASLDREREGETERERMIRGAYVGRLRPGRVSSRLDGDVGMRVGLKGDGRRRKRARERERGNGSGLRNVVGAREQGMALATPTSTSALVPAVQDNAAVSSTEQGQAPLKEHQHDEHEDTASEDEEEEQEDPSSTPAEILSNNTNNNNDHHHQQTPLVRIHSECYTGETAWSARCDCGEQLDEAARLMSLPSQLSPGGVIVYLRQEGRGIGLASKLKAYNLQDLGSDTVEANLLLRHPADARSYGLATSILVDLGCGGERGIRLMTNNPDKIRAVEGPGREVIVRERVAMVPRAWRSRGREGVRGVEIEKYLSTKIGKMGHLLEERDGWVNS